MTDSMDLCNPHPKAKHGFARQASHANDKYVCECAGFDPYDAGYQDGIHAAWDADGLLLPEGYVLVPIEPTVEQIEEGAKGIASWEADCVWPVSWSNSQVLRMRKDARSAYVAMLAAAPKQENSND